MKILLCAFLLIGTGATAQVLETGTTPASQPLGEAELRQSATRQEQIRTEARVLVDRLDEFKTEYTRNGLATGEDFETLKSVRGVLGSLSDEEMEKVVGLLKQAAELTGDTPDQMARAYSAQKDISLQLKQILAAHEQQLDIDALARGVRQLTDRQSANLSTAIDARQLAAQDKSPNGKTAVAASEQAQQSEQGAIGGEAKLIADQLGKIAAGAPDGKYKEAAAQLGRAQSQAEAASGALGDGRMDDAVTAETAARDQLAAVARALAPASAPDAGADLGAAELAAIVREQRALLAQSAKLSAALRNVTDEQSPDATSKAMNQQLSQPKSLLAQRLAGTGITAASPPDQIRNAPEMKAFLAARADALKRQAAALQPQLTALAATEAALAAKAQMAREDLRKTVKEAAAPMANAVTQMNSAQESLAEGDGEQAVQNETEAANQLDQAARLAEQNANTPPQAASVQSPEQQLRQLQDGVRDLTARETESVRQGDARKTGPMGAAAADLQGDLAGKAQALEQAADAEGSPGAPALRQAADALQSAAGSMRAGGTAAEYRGAPAGRAAGSRAGGPATRSTGCHDGAGETASRPDAKGDGRTRGSDSAATATQCGNGRGCERPGITTRLEGERIGAPAGGDAESDTIGPAGGRHGCA